MIKIIAAGIMFLQLCVVNVVCASDLKIVNAANYIDVVSGALISPAVIVIEAGKISAINPDVLPSGPQIIDLGDSTLLPCVMDMHSHVTLD
jgi:imidazolonepropionase-like amidohydrolase